ncbi:synaptic vesicular amine transporter [Zeugodacus cucurbitae]|uniref:synaptic vesicular amine transporter n=1 Tax=Zeugodacus cucurbitae TaxID=28588 RepID=UPI0023D94518|nr:synaptic vesicular amine transporter [Zeugodacus cucurbitae]
MIETRSAEVADDHTSVARTASVLNAAGGERRSSTPKFGNTNRCIIAVIVYLALLLDNVLLTVIVPILPDYLATINNRAHHTPLEMLNNNNNYTSDAVNAGIASPFMAPPSLAHRYMDVAHQPVQTVMTKHPIPGKSMVNFTLPHGDDKATFLSTEHKQLRYINAGAGGGTLTKGAISGNTTVAGDRAVEKVIDESNFNEDATRIANAAPLTTAATADSGTDADGDAKAHTDQNESLTSENSAIGILLSMKALVQLIFNPIVGNLTSKFGYRLPIVAGTFLLLLSSLVFSVGETYIELLIARAIQGVGSACIGVCGMSLVAQHYPEEERRSKVMGIILGSIALGVLLGYPFGSILYDLIGKSAPFIILSTVIFLNLGMQLLTMDLSIQPEVTIATDEQLPKWRPLLESKMILAIVVAIWFSTSTMAILEPCLPIWLMQHIHPTKWQLGTVFIPDSVGYFIGTNFFGTFAYKYGQVKISCIALLLVGISSILIPSATTVSQLLLPHFGLGLSIGVIDAALVPLLATFVDATLAQEEQGDSGGGNSMSSYGTVYAIQQTSVSLAYCLAPLLGGELAQTFGFAWLMRIVGFFNICYGPVLVFLHQNYNPKTIREKHNELLLRNSGRDSQYKQLYNSIDIE